MKTFLYILILFSTLLLAFKLEAETYFSDEIIKEQLIIELRKSVGNEAEIILPKTIGNFSFKENNVVMNFDFGNQILSGNVIVGIEFWWNQQKIRRVEVPIRIKLFKEVLVATKTISRGEVISNENCVLEKREIPSSIDPTKTSFDLVFGKNAKYFIVKGSIITSDLVQEPFAVRRGEKVRVVVLSGKVQINTFGVALNDANAGETVRVRRDGNNNIVVGLASKDGCVIISK
ncbi:flagella basal body P-ring formation protein FlgA [Bacteroidetes/Chlorobi group bacterium Naka2016]|jgi:flagella basal body P-ring formation protein FlgA|nr:MAG: flagella basal body P-ring formation protein FlgA [Bacteroidetes/Chlorobi group bacterium Naka2016]